MPQLLTLAPFAWQTDAERVLLACRMAGVGGWMMPDARAAVCGLACVAAAASSGIGSRHRPRQRPCHGRAAVGLLRLRSLCSTPACGRRGRWRNDNEIDRTLDGILFGIGIGGRVETSII